MVIACSQLFIFLIKVEVSAATVIKQVEMNSDLKTYNIDGFMIDQSNQSMVTLIVFGSHWKNTTVGPNSTQTSKTDIKGMFNKMTLNF